LILLHVIVSEHSPIILNTMHTPAYFSAPDHDPRRKPIKPSEKTGYRPDDGEGGTYEKEGNKQPKGNEMPGIDNSTEEGEARNARIKIVHDPKSDNSDLDEFTDRVNERKPAESNPDNATGPKR
jgi:hypothetical protein